MSRAENQPIESQVKKTKDRTISTGNIIGLIFSAAIFGSGVTQVVDAVLEERDLHEQNPQLGWGQDIESDFQVEIDRVLRENDTQGLKKLEARIPIVSSALIDQAELKEETSSISKKGFYGAMTSLLGIVGITLFFPPKTGKKWSW